MADEAPLPPWRRSAFSQLAWVTDLLAEREAKTEDESNQLAQHVAEEVDSHAAALKAREGELTRERALSAVNERQAREALGRAEQAEKERDDLRAQLARVTQERDEAIAASLTGEADPGTGAAISWKGKAEQWNAAFILAKRRAERAEADFAALAARLKEAHAVDAKRAEELSLEGLAASRRPMLAQS
jgi:hypothetical protein